MKNVSRLGIIAAAISLGAALGAPATGMASAASPTIAPPPPTATFSPTRGPVGTVISFHGSGCPGDGTSGSPELTFSVVNGPGRSDVYDSQPDGTFSGSYTVQPSDTKEGFPATGSFKVEVYCIGTQGDTILPQRFDILASQSADTGTTITPSTTVTNDGAVSGYTITVTNPGPSTARDVTVTGEISPNMEIDTPAHIGSSKCSPGSDFSCDLGNLAKGATKHITLQVKAEDASAAATNIVSDVKVTSSTSDPNTGNDSAASDQTIRADNAKPVTSPATSPLSVTTSQTAPGPVSWKPYCGVPGSGNGGEGYLGATLTAQENGQSGTTHFTLDWKLQRQNDDGSWGSYAGDGNYSADSNVFPDDARSFYWTKYHFFTFSLDDDSGTFRLLGRAKFVHNRSAPLPDKVLYTSPWYLLGNVCSAQA